MPSSTYGQEWIEYSNIAREHERFLQDGELRPRQVRAIALAGMRPGDVVLDMGCGRGEVSLFCARMGVRVIALDYSLDCLSLAAQSASRTLSGSSGRVLVARGDSKALPLKTGSVTRVLLLDVVEHLHAWELALALSEAHRVLKPGGCMVIHTLPNRWALEVGYRWARTLFRRLPAEPRSEWERIVHISEQDFLGLYRSLKKAGFLARVWLEDSILAQAQWQRGGKAFPPSDQRAKVYPLLVNPLVRALFRLAMASPLRFILANDIYALAWKGYVPPGTKQPGRLEKALCTLAGGGRR